MSVLINGMEMPTSCRKCMISQPDGCGWICPIIESKPIVDGRVNSRHPHCPLVPVPPHGRLIDADALYKRFYAEELTMNKPYIDYLGLVVEAPTIIEAEEE